MNYLVLLFQVRDLIKRIIHRLCLVQHKAIEVQEIQTWPGIVITNCRTIQSKSNPALCPLSSGPQHFCNRDWSYEDTFSQTGGGVWFQDDSSMLTLVCNLFLLLFRSSGIRSHELGNPSPRVCKRIPNRNFPACMGPYGALKIRGRKKRANIYWMYTILDVSILKES